MASNIISRLTTAACGLLTVGVLVALPASARAEEGKCSADKKAHADAHHEPHCGASKGAHEGKCAADKKEPHCGASKGEHEGKCAADKAAEHKDGKCGEGKCGEGKK